MTEADRTAKAVCTRFLPMHLPEAPAEALRRLADMDAAREPADTYGDSGAVVRLGKAHGVATPTHDFVHRALHPYVDGKAA